MECVCSTLYKGTTLLLPYSIATRSRSMYMSLKNINDYDYFSNRHVYIGVAVHQHTPQWEHISEYMKLQKRYDDIYGYERITEIADKDIADRFYKALKKFRYVVNWSPDGNHVTDKEHVNLIKIRSEICQRGLKALDKYCIDNNLRPQPDIWITYTKGKKVGIAKTVEDLRSAKALDEQIDIMLSLEEIGLMLIEYQDILKAKEVLRKKDIPAKVVQIEENKTNIGDDFDEDVPF